MRFPRYSEKEVITRDGAVILGPNQLALLLGLMDRPGYEAESSRDLLDAAVPYMRLFRSPSLDALQKSVRRLNPAWISRRREGRRAVWRLTERGIAIVERSVPSHIMGFGPYTGVAALRARTLQSNRWEAVAWQWRYAATDIAMTPMLDMADALVKAWLAQTRVSGMGENLRRHYQLQVLEMYVRTYVLKHCRLPTGTHSLAGGSMIIDFDKLFRAS